MLRNSVRRWVLVLLVWAVVGPGLAYAQSTPGQPLGWIYLSSDNTVYKPDIYATAFVPFTFYMMLNLDYGFINRSDLNTSTGVQAWEASLILPAEFTILSVTVQGVSQYLGDATNLIVGLPATILAAQTPTDLVAYSVGKFTPGDPVDVVLDIGPHSPSSFSPAAPGMNDSADIGECTKISDGSTVKCLRPFAKVSRAVINCNSPWCDPCGYIGCATENTRWSTIKATFDPSGG